VFKRFMRWKPTQVTLGFILAAYMVLVKYSTRWEIERADVSAPIIGTGEGLIALTWHSRFLLLNSAWKKKWQLPHVLISLSRDGALVHYTTKFLGLKVIRGSARKAGSAKAKGGSEAARDIRQAIESGGCIVITPDGPRGPRQRLGAGPLRLAKMTGAPILPCTFATKWRIQFASWDKFNLPLPFGKGKIIWGTPVHVPDNASDVDIEKLRGQIESEMNVFLAKADTGLGNRVIDPDERQAK